MSLEQLYAAGSVQRFHTLRTIQKHTIAHHSWGVILILLKITAPSANLLAAAAYHDLAESITGDIPAPTKWAYPKLDDAIGTVEYDFESTHGIIVDLSDEEHDMLKWADMMELLLYCKSEADMGNKPMLEVFNRGYAVLTSKRAPTVAADKLLKELISAC